MSLIRSIAASSKANPKSDTMTINAEFIDQIVHSVMREMQIRTTSNAPVALRDAVVEKSPTDKTISINNRVVSENVLKIANAAGRTILLQQGTVITPSGRDFIRKNGVRLASDVGATVNAATGGTFITVGAGTTSSAATAAGWKTLTAVSETAAAVLASEKLATGMVASFGGEPSVVACLLNRNSAVRAAVVTRTTDLPKLTGVMNPQVICLDSMGWSFAELLRLLRGLSMSSMVPKQWQELTGGNR